MFILFLSLRVLQAVHGFPTWCLQQHDLVLLQHYIDSVHNHLHAEVGMGRQILCFEALQGWWQDVLMGDSAMVPTPSSTSTP